MFKSYNQTTEYKPSVYLDNPVKQSLFSGYSYYKFEFTGNIGEMQYEVNGENKTFSSGNGCTLSVISGFGNPESLSQISDGAIPGSGLNIGVGAYVNDSYYGPAIMKASFNSPVFFNRIWLAPGLLNSTTAIYFPGTIKVSFSSDDITYSSQYTLNVASDGIRKLSTPLADHGFVLGQLKLFEFPYQLG